MATSPLDHLEDGGENEGPGGGVGEAEGAVWQHQGGGCIYGQPARVAGRDSKDVLDGRASKGDITDINKDKYYTMLARKWGFLEALARQVMGCHTKRCLGSTNWCCPERSSLSATALVENWRTGSPSLVSGRNVY